MKNRKKRTSFKRKAEILTLVALGTMSISGSFAYVSVKNAEKDNGNNGSILTPDIDRDDDDSSHDALSYILNNMLSCKSMKFNNLDIVANPGSASTQATIALSDLGVDLTNLNSTSISAQGNMAVCFGGYEKESEKGDVKKLNNTITTSMHFALEDLTTLYLSAFNGHFKLSAPRTIAQISALINKFTPSSENKPSQTSNNNTDIMEIVNKVKEVISGSDTSIGLSIVDNKKDSIVITINDMVFGKTGETQTVISGLKIVLGYEGTWGNNDGVLTDATLTSLEVGSQAEPIKIQQQYNGSKVNDVLASLYISTGENGIVIDKENGMTLDDHSNYNDMTDPNQSVFSTIGDIFMKNSNGSVMMAKANIGLNIDIDNFNQETYAKKENFMSFDGSLKLDASSVSQFLSSSRMLLELNNVKKGSDVSQTEKLDSLKMYYAVGNEGAAYINFDDAYKVKIDNTASSELVKYLSDNGNDIISSITDQVKAALNAVPSDAIKDAAENDTKTSEIIDKIADFVYQKTGTLPNSDLNSLINFDYIPDTAAKKGTFVFKLRKDLLGMKTVDPENLSDTDWMSVSIHITTDKITITNGKIDETYKGRIQDVTISGIDINDKTVIVKIDLSKITDVNIESDVFTEDEHYVSINGTVGIIKTLGNYIINQKGGVNYALTYLPENKDTSSSFGMSGSIGVDLSEINSFKQLGSSGSVLGLTSSQFYFTSEIATKNASDTSKNHSRNLEVSYKKEENNSRNLYFAYDDCFKNYVSDASISDICSVLDNKVSGQSSSAPLAISGMDEVLSALGVSEKFQNDIKAIVNDKSLRTLNSFLTVTQGESKDVLVLSLNLSYIFAGSDLASKVKSIDVTLDASTESFKSIKVGGYRDNNNALLEFEVDFTDFNMPTTDYGDYVEIKDATSIFDSFYNLPTTLDEYGLGINASLTDNTNNQLVVGLNSGLVIDRTHNNYDGAVVISHPSLSNLDGGNSMAKQKIEFAYDSMEKQESGDYVSIQDPTFVAEYNDRMHIKMGSSSVKDLVSTISNDKSTHKLLEALTSLNLVANGLPLEKAATTKDASVLLENKLIDKVVFDDANNQIVLTMFASLFNSEASDTDRVTVSVSYTEATKDEEGKVTDHSSAKLNRISLSGLTLKGGKQIEASISLESDYQNTLDNAVKDTVTGETAFHVARPGDKASNGQEVGFINLADFNDLIKAGIDTTNFNYYSLAGNVSLDLTAWLQESQIDINEFSFDLSLKFTFFIADGQLYADFYINRGQNQFADFKFNGDYVYVTSSNDTEKGQYKTYRMKKADVTSKNNMLYLLLSEGLGIDSHIAGRTLMAQLYAGFNNSVVNPEENAEETVEESVDEKAEESTSSGLNLPIKLGITDDFSSILANTAIQSKVNTGVEGEQVNKWSIVLNPNSLFTSASDISKLVSFGETRLDIYDMAIRNQNDDGSWTRTTTPLYGMNLKTAINLLPGTYGDDTQVARVKLGLSLHANYSNNTDGYGIVSDDMVKNYRDSTAQASNDSTAEAKSNTEIGVSNFFACTHNIDKVVTSDFNVNAVSLISKELYDFSSGNLIEFYNNYNIDTSAIVYINDIFEYYKD